jgi:hypothetical protein
VQAINVIPWVPGTPAFGPGGLTEQNPAVAQANYLIAGTSKDSTGAALPSCVTKLFRSSDSLYTAQSLSDGSGNFRFYVVAGVQYYLVAYKAGSPDVAGTTVNTLTGSQV